MTPRVSPFVAVPEPAAASCPLTTNGRVSRQTACVRTRGRRFRDPDELADALERPADRTLVLPPVRLRLAVFDVVTGIDRAGVVAALAVHGVAGGSVGNVERIVAEPAPHQVGLRAPGQLVAPALAEDDVVASLAQGEVVPAPQEQVVAAGVADHVVIVVGPDHVLEPARVGQGQRQAGGDGLWGGGTE